MQAFNWRGHSSVDWQTRTDAEGRFAWRDAPSDVVSYNILKPGFMPVRRRWYKASDQQYRITLNRPLRIRGSVVDQKTGKPIDGFTVVPALIAIWDSTGGDPLFARSVQESRRQAMANPPFKRAWAKTFRDGQYEFEFPSRARAISSASRHRVTNRRPRAALMPAKGMKSTTSS